MKPDLRITATDTVTIFTGATNVQRHDVPTAREIAAHVRSVLGPAPRGAVVQVAATRERLHALEQALGGYDIQLVTEELPDELAAEVPNPRREDPAPPTDPPTDTFGAVDAGAPEGGSGTWIVTAVAVLVAAASAAALYYTVLREPAQSPGVSAAIEASTTSAAPTMPVQPAPREGPGALGETLISTSPRTPQQSVRLGRDGISVELPAGYAIEADGDMWRAVGDDPNFRMQLAVEHLGEQPANTMAQQLVADIANDPDVELVQTDAHAVTYLERAADGSQALWKTWPEGHYQVFIGCHTRFAPTQHQQDTCRRAMESAEFQKNSGTDGTGA